MKNSGTRPSLRHSVEDVTRRATVRRGVLLRARRFEEVLKEALATDNPVAFQEATEAIVDAGDADFALRFLQEYEALGAVMKAHGLIGIARGVKRFLKSEETRLTIN